MPNSLPVIGQLHKYYPFQADRNTSTVTGLRNLRLNIKGHYPAFENLFRLERLGVVPLVPTPGLRVTLDAPLFTPALPAAPAPLPPTRRTLFA